MFNVKLRNIYLFTLFIALFYGLTPLFSSYIFGSDVKNLGIFSFYFSVYFLLVSLLFFVPKKSKQIFLIQVNLNRIRTLQVISLFLFISINIALYGSFQKAFIDSYISRTGVDFSGPIALIFYPILVLFTSSLSIYSISILTSKRRILDLVLLSLSILTIFALGSRNILLWSLSGVALFFISKVKTKSLIFFLFGIYFFTIFFAYMRNTGIISMLTKSDFNSIKAPDKTYYDPLIHEFGSSYRTFDMVLNSFFPLSNSPYGLKESYILNILPSFLKPTEFITQTNYISQILAEPGEGLGNSPMTELLINGTSALIFFLLNILIVIYPAFYLSKKSPTFSFLSLSLLIAFSFNIWRIGSPEILKMYLSSLLSISFVAFLSRFRVLKSQNK